MKTTGNPLECLLVLHQTQRSEETVDNLPFVHSLSNNSVMNSNFQLHVHTGQLASVSLPLIFSC